MDVAETELKQSSRCGAACFYRVSRTWTRLARKETVGVPGARGRPCRRRGKPGGAHAALLLPPWPASPLWRALSWPWLPPRGAPTRFAVVEPCASVRSSRFITVASISCSLARMARTTKEGPLAAGATCAMAGGGANHCIQATRRRQWRDDCRGARASV
jgi:hypothetical protein